MSTLHTYTAQPRTALGSTAATKLRAQGIVPLTVSRPGKPSEHLQLDEKSAFHLAGNVVHLCKVDVAGKAITTLRGDIAKDVLTDKIKHIDLKEVDGQSDIVVDVAVVPDARNCAGIKAGGLVELRSRTIKVKCKANAIPDHVGVDITEVELMQSITVGAIKLPAGITLVTPAKTLLLSVVVPRGLKIAEAEAAAATADGATPAAGADGAAAPAAAGADGKPAAAADAKGGAKAAPAAKDAAKKK